MLFQLTVDKVSYDQVLDQVSCCKKQQHKNAYLFVCLFFVLAGNFFVVGLVEFFVCSWILHVHSMLKMFKWSFFPVERFLPLQIKMLVYRVGKSQRKSNREWTEQDLEYSLSCARSILWLADDLQMHQAKTKQNKKHLIIYPFSFCPVSCCCAFSCFWWSIHNTASIKNQQILTVEDLCSDSVQVTISKS